VWKGESLTEIGMRDLVAQLAHHLHGLPLDVGAADPLVHRNVEDVELERVRSHFFDGAGVPEPAAQRGAVERSDDRYADGLLRSPDRLEILVGADLELGRLRHEVRRLREHLRMGLQRGEGRHRFGVELLLEQRAKHDRGRARIFRAPHPAQGVTQRAGSDDQRMFELQSEVVRLHVDHGITPQSW
jgi:hypothetical protein